MLHHSQCTLREWGKACGWTARADAMLLLGVHWRVSHLARPLPTGGLPRRTFCLGKSSRLAPSLCRLDTSASVSGSYNRLSLTCWPAPARVSRLPAALPACCCTLSPVSLALLEVMPVASDTCCTRAHLPHALAGHFFGHLSRWHARWRHLLASHLTHLPRNGFATILPQALPCHSSL